MTRRTLLVPLFALACTLTPAELSGQIRPLTGVFDRASADWTSLEEVTTPGGTNHRPVVGRIWRVEE